MDSEKVRKEQEHRQRLEIWSEQVPIPDIYGTRGATIERTELRAITLMQLNDLAHFIEKNLERKKSKKISTSASIWLNQKIKKNGPAILLKGLNIKY